MPTLFEHAGGQEALHKLEQVFYDSVLADPLLQPLFGAGQPEHVDHLTAFTAESFGGPDRFSRELGFAHLISVHRGLRITEEQRQRFVELYMAALDAAEMPSDPAFREAVREHVEFGSKVAMQNSHAENDDELHPLREVPRWTWPGDGRGSTQSLQVDCRAVLFDLDGVLVDSTASVERHWTAFAARHGVDQQAIHRVMHGRRSPDIIREVAPDLDAEAEGLRIDQEQAADGEGVRPIAGAGQVLAALSGARWAVVTSGPRFLAEARLRMVGLPSAEVLIGGDEVPHGKPDPFGYLKAAARLGVDPADCVVLEDAPAGVRAGIAAGMRVIGVLTNHLTAELPGVRAAVADLCELEVLRADREGIGLLVAPAAG